MFKAVKEDNAMNKGIDFKDLEVWASEQSPVFVLGPERSGTSMMFRVLVSHPSFCKFHNATVETFAFVNPEKLLEKPSPENYEVRLYLGKKYDAFRRSVTKLKLTTVKNNRLTVVGNQALKGKGASDEYCNLLRAFFYYSWLNLGRKRLAEKTPAHVRNIENIIECFPNSKILVCLRNPLEIIASHRKRLSNELSLGKDERDPSLGWLKKSVSEYVNYFSSIEKKVREAEKHTNNILRVSYSKATQDADYLESVFKFIDEDPSKRQLDGRITNDSALKWDPLLKALPQSNTISVGDFLTESEVAEFEKLSASIELDWR